MNRLKELREERGYSVRGMELRTKINYNSICKYENETRKSPIDISKFIKSL